MTEIAIVGRWAKEKLDALGRYLDFYTKVLKNQRWRTIYVDAFAGGGRAVVRPDAKCAPPGLLLFEAEEVDADQRELIDGSPRVALNVANPFGGLEGANYILRMGERIDIGSRRAGEAS